MKELCKHTFKSRLELSMTRNEITVKQLSQKTQISDCILYSALSGKSMPNPENVYKLACSLGTSSDRLLGLCTVAYLPETRPREIFRKDLVAERFWETRKCLKMQLDEFGCLVGIDVSTVSAIESGEFTPRTQTLFQTALATGISTDYFIGLIDTKISHSKKHPRKSA